LRRRFIHIVISPRRALDTSACAFYAATCALRFAIPAFLPSFACLPTPPTCSAPLFDYCRSTPGFYPNVLLPDHITCLPATFSPARLYCQRSGTHWQRRAICVSTIYRPYTASYRHWNTCNNSACYKLPLLAFRVYFLVHLLICLLSRYCLRVHTHATLTRRRGQQYNCARAYLCAPFATVCTRTPGMARTTRSPTLGSVLARRCRKLYASPPRLRADLLRIHTVTPRSTARRSRAFRRQFAWFATIAPPLRFAASPSLHVCLHLHACHLPACLSLRLIFLLPARYLLVCSASFLFCRLPFAFRSWLTYNGCAFVVNVLLRALLLYNTA